MSKQILHWNSKKMFCLWFRAISKPNAWDSYQAAEGCKNNSSSSSFDIFPGFYIVDWALVSHCSSSIAPVIQHDRISEWLLFGEAWATEHYTTGGKKKKTQGCFSYCFWPTLQGLDHSLLLIVFCGSWWFSLQRGHVVLEDRLLFGTGLFSSQPT